MTFAQRLALNRFRCEAARALVLSCRRYIHGEQLLEVDTLDALFEGK